MSVENTLNVEQHIDHLIETSLQKLNITGTKNEKNEESNTPADVDGFNTALHQYLEIEEEINFCGINSPSTSYWIVYL